MQTILMVEDNPDIMKINRMALKNEYQILEAKTLSDARKQLKENPDLIILDIMLPDGSGLEFLEEIHNEADTPILLLTAPRTNEEMVEGLMRGGDDYITKPYDINVLAARVKALLRRSEKIEKAKNERTLTLGGLSLSHNPHIAELDGRRLPLTPKDLALLQILVENQSQYVSVQQLYKQVWGTGYYNNKPVKQHIYRLRKKLGENSSISIEAMQGKGYRIICKS